MSTQDKTTRREFLATASTMVAGSAAFAAAGKSMGNCMATGHAAGVPAARCAKDNCLPRELKVVELQDGLRADGVNFEVKDRDQRTL